MEHSFGGTLDPGRIGAKAANLHRLIALGLPVPATFVLPNRTEGTERRRLADWLAGLPRDRQGWSLAIRSSSPVEDGFLESKAGHFLSLTGRFDETGVGDSIARVQSSGTDIAVIVQPLVDPAFAGVYFSCDPLSFARRRPLIAWTTGLSDRLLTGLETGEHVWLDGRGRVVDGNWPSAAVALEQLHDAGRQLESDFAAPVDIEWAIDLDGQLWFLQARPIVLPESSRIRLADVESIEKLPAPVRRHHKIRLRRQAALLGIPMAPALVEIWSRPGADLADDSKEILGKAAAVSVVLLHPEHIDCAVVREFAALRPPKANAWTERCRRYAVRRYPNVGGVGEAKKAVLDIGLGQSWLAAAIAQAVWDARATGIIRRTPDNYFIDVALGHFVPKGVVPTSTIILSRDKAVLSKQWREQGVVYHFIDGHVVTETPPRQQLQLSDHDLVRIAETLDPLFDVYQDAALEFGLLGEGDEALIYLIDVAEGDEASIQLDGDMIRTGVLSAGSCCGRIVRIENSSASALDNHLHDRRVQMATGSDRVVIVAEQASTDLLGYACAPGVAGFVFRHASVLSHLPVVLREKGLPAIALDDSAVHASLREGLQIELDAMSRMSSASARVRLPTD